MRDPEPDTCDRYDPKKGGVCDRPLDEAGRCNIAADHDEYEIKQDAWEDATWD